MPQLTKAMIDRSPNKETAYLIWDDIIKGFGCRIHPSKKTFMYMYRSPATRKSSYITIGVYGSITVDEARTQAKRFAHSVQIEKIDPRDIKKLQDREREVEAQQSTTFEEFLTIFLEKYPKEASWKPSTFKVNSYVLKNRILPFFGKKPMVGIDRKDILEFKDLIYRSNIKNNKYIVLLSTIFKQAALWGYRPRNSNPCEEISKDIDGKMERFLSIEELERLEKTLIAKEIKALASPYTINAFRLLMYTGCRRGEIMSLKWEEVDFADRCLRLNDSKTGKRTIPLNESAIKVLQNIQKQVDNPYVCCGTKSGTHLSDLQSTWQSIRKQAGIPDVRIHDLRHSFASFMIKSGLSIFEVSKLLGHSSINTTMRYAHLADRELVNITNKGGKLFEANNKYSAR
jgi:integrase